MSSLVTQVGRRWSGTGNLEECCQAAFLHQRGGILFIGHPSRSDTPTFI